MMATGRSSTSNQDRAKFRSTTRFSPSSIRAAPGKLSENDGQVLAWFLLA
jgi:hypothetical protein